MGPPRSRLSQATQALHPPGDVIHQQGSSCPSVITPCHRPVRPGGPSHLQGWGLPRDCPLCGERLVVRRPPLLLAHSLEPDLCLLEIQFLGLRVFLNYYYSGWLFESLTLYPSWPQVPCLSHHTHRCLGLEPRAWHMLGKCSTQSYTPTLHFSLIQGHAISPRLTPIHCILGKLALCFFYVGVGWVCVFHGAL